MNNNIPKQVLQGLKSVVTETTEKTVEEAGKIVTGVITGGELLGGIKAMTPEEQARKHQEEEKKKQEEMKKIREQMERGRNVEGEMKQVRQEEEQKAKQEEQEFLAKLQQQREAEEAERQQLEASMGGSSNPAKKKKSRGSAFVQGKKKSQPQADQMSATSEFKGKID